MSDLVSRVLAAIEETERNAEAATHMRWVFDTNRRNGRTVMEEFFTRHSPAAVLRRCAADREIVELHGIVWRDIGWLAEEDGEMLQEEAELPVCGLCVPRHSSFRRREDVPEGPCRTVQLIGRGYGISVEEETTDEEPVG